MPQKTREMRARLSEFSAIFRLISACVLGLAAAALGLYLTFFDDFAVTLPGATARETVQKQMPVAENLPAISVLVTKADLSFDGPQKLRVDAQLRVSGHGRSGQGNAVLSAWLGYDQGVFSLAGAELENLTFEPDAGTNDFIAAASRNSSDWRRFHDHPESRTAEDIAAWKRIMDQAMNRLRPETEQLLLAGFEGLPVIEMGTAASRARMPVYEMKNAVVDAGSIKLTLDPRNLIYNLMFWCVAMGSGVLFCVVLNNLLRARKEAADKAAKAAVKERLRIAKEREEREEAEARAAANTPDPPANEAPVARTGT